MAVRHTLKCFDSEILVCEKGVDSFQVNIQSAANPLGFGKTIETYDNVDKAIEAAGHLCHVYTVAREKGYYLQDTFFTKGSQDEKIPVNEIILSAQSVQRFVAGLED